ncbi:MAG: DUF885 family protein [Asticcacaulis sp.]|nr:DUF885 family protein [Asticcacaulis sp.]
MTGLLHATAFALVLVAAGSTAHAAAKKAGPDARFVALYTKEWAWRGQQMAANEDTPAGQAAALLPDVSEASQQRKLAYWQDVLKALKAIDPKTLSAQHAEDYAVYRFQIETLIADQVYKTYQRPLAGDTSFWGDLADMARGTFRTEDDYRNYISQLNDFPRYFQQNTDNMRAGLKRGFTTPQVVLQGRDATIATGIGPAAPEDNIYYTPFKTMPATIPADRAAAIRAEGLAAVRDKVIPAHKALLAFFRSEYQPGAVKSLAAVDLPDGRAFYQSQIREYTTLNTPPDQIHQLGLDEVAHLQAEMRAVMIEVGFKGDIAAFNAYLRTAPQFYVTKPQDLLDRAAWVATGGRGGPGIYLVNTYNLPSRPLYSLPALTMHESAPGHAFQMPLASENKALPPFRRDTYISAYGEGWALYCERLGDEMGIYTTPYERYGMLSYQMWRAARLVVDTGLHSQGWTRERAQQYLLANTALSEHEVTTEVDRYVAWPAQALSYYLGEMDIWKNRHRAEKALGEKFDVRNFHDAVLDLGSVPLPVIDARIDRFIADGGKSPYGDEK